MKFPPRGPCPIVFSKMLSFMFYHLPKGYLGWLGKNPGQPRARSPRGYLYHYQAVVGAHRHTPHWSAHPHGQAL